MTESYRDLVHVALNGDPYFREDPSIEDGVIRVRMLEYGISGKGHKLKTKNLYTCMGVVLYNPKLQVGLMAHMTWDQYLPDHRAKSMPKCFSDALEKNIGEGYKPSEFNGVVIGVSNHSSDRTTPAQLEKQRIEGIGCVERMVALLHDSGFVIFDPEKPGFTVDYEVSRILILDNSTGILSIRGERSNSSKIEECVEKAILHMGSGKVEYELKPEFPSELVR